MFFLIVIYVGQLQVNVNDSDGGCLVGKWSGEDKDYADGVMPTSWSGSEAILKQYLATRRPVKYGQCWVFGGTLDGRTEEKHIVCVLSCIALLAFQVTNFVQTLVHPARVDLML